MVCDEVRKTTCYMCACRCGIDVHIKDGQVRYIAGNRDHPVNRGVICGKGSAGIMQHLSPARLRKPLLRTGARGAGEFREIEWDEALAIAAQRLARIRATDPKKLAFFTGRDQSQSLTGWWAAQFGTPNYAAHGGFCSVNMAAAGFYTIGGSFWEFGEPDWEHTKYFMLFGVAEDHDSNPIKIGLGRLKARGVKVISVNPCRTGYNAIADEWIGIRPGTDGLFVLALVHELLRAGRVDLDYLIAYSNAPVLIIREPGAADDGLIMRDPQGAALAFDRVQGRAVDAAAAGTQPALTGSYQVNGRTACRCFRSSPNAIWTRPIRPRRSRAAAALPPPRSGGSPPSSPHVAFEQAIELPVPWTDYRTGAATRPCGGARSPCMRCAASRPIRTASTPAAPFICCRCCWARWMCRAAFASSRPTPSRRRPAASPAAKAAGIPTRRSTACRSASSCDPQDLLVDADGRPERIDKAYSWEAPLAAHGLMHTVIGNAARGDPYPIDTLFIYMANIAWNSAMNTTRDHRAC